MYFRLLLFFRVQLFFCCAFAHIDMKNNIFRLSHFISSSMHSYELNGMHRYASTLHIAHKNFAYTSTPKSICKSLHIHFIIFACVDCTLDMLLLFFFALRFWILLLLLLRLIHFFSSEVQNQNVTTNTWSDAEKSCREQNWRVCEVPVPVWIGCVHHSIYFDELLKSYFMFRKCAFVCYSNFFRTFFCCLSFFTFDMKILWVSVYFDQHHLLIHP